VNWFAKAGVGGLLAAVGFAAAGIPQKSGRATPAQQKEPAPMVRVTTRLVQVGVLVHDRYARPVADLKREDFTLLEAGREQPISAFSVEITRASRPEARPLPPDTFSNLAEFRGNTPANLTVILLDSINTLIQDQAYARQRIIKFLEQLRPEDRVALYILNEFEILVLQDFTQDVNRLLSSLQRYKGQISRLPDASEPYASDTGFPELDDFVRRGDERVAIYYTRDRVLKTAAALESIAHHLARIPGRKNLVWVSAGFPISFGEQAVQNQRSPLEERAMSDLNRNPRGKSTTSTLETDARASSTLSPERSNFYKEVERAARAITDANVAVYPVDARGLLGAVMPGAQRLQASGAAPGAEGFTSLATQASNLDSLQVLAERTGGHAFFNMNDLESAIRRAIDDSQVTYLLGFYPTHGKWDGTFREIKVRVNRPDVRVRARAGYFALAEQPDDEVTRRRLMGEAARSPLDATAVGISAKVTKQEDAEVTRLSLAVTVNTRDLTLEQQPAGAGRWFGGVDAVFVQLAADGRLIDVDTTEVKMNFDDERFRQLKSEGLIIHKTVELKYGAVTLRVVVRDELSGLIGSVAVPLDRLREPARMQGTFRETAGRSVALACRADSLFCRRGQCGVNLFPLRRREGKKGPPGRPAVVSPALHRILHAGHAVLAHNHRRRLEQPELRRVGSRKIPGANGLVHFHAQFRQEIRHGEDSSHGA
jgi:VWFA-related protein